MAGNTCTLMRPPDSVSIFFAHGTMTLLGM